MSDLPDGLTIEECTEEEELAGGKPCQLHDLKAKPALNGRCGKTLAWDAEAGRMGVKLSDGTKLAVKIANLHFGDDIKPQLEPPPPPPPTPPKSDHAPLYISLVGAECDALRPALHARNLAERVNLGQKVDIEDEKSKGMESATVENVLACLAASKGKHQQEVVTQALTMLNRVATGAPGQDALLKRSPGAHTTAGIMSWHKENAAVQSGGFKLLKTLATSGPDGLDAVIHSGGGDRGCMRVVWDAMAETPHRTSLDVQSNAMELLVTLTSGSMGEAATLPMLAGGGGGASAQERDAWKAIDASDGGKAQLARLVAGAMAAHVGTAEATVHTDSSRAMQLQSSGCRVLTSLALTGDAGRDAVCVGGGAKAAVAAMSGETLREDQSVRQWAMFLLANLCNGNDKCKAAVGEAGAANTLADVVVAYKARADVLRLSVGALSHLAATDAGRTHVIKSKASEAVVLSMRAHMSEPEVLDECCRYIAALAYGGAEGRKAALDAKADEILKVAIARFGKVAKFAEAIEMAKVIATQLEKARSEEGYVSID